MSAPCHALCRGVLALSLCGVMLAAIPRRALAQGEDPRRAALAAFQRDDLAEAERLLGAWLTARPDDLDGHLLLGLIRVTASQELGRKDGAPERVRALSHAAIEPLLAAERLAGARPVPDLEHALGYALMLDGRFREAAERFGRALALKPGDVELSRQRGNCYLELGDYAAAERDLRRVVAAGRGDLKSHVSHARALFLLGRESEAREALRRYHRSIAGQPPDERHFRTLQGIANYSMMMNELGPARDALAEACAIRPGDAVCAAALGEVEYKLGDFAAARGLLDRARASSGAPRATRGEAAHHRGLIALADGDAEAARGLFEESLALAPGRGETLRNYAATLRRLGEQERAAEVLTRFREVSELELALGRLEDRLLVDPADREARAERVRLLSRLGRGEEAAAELLQLRFADPDHPALPALARLLRDAG